MDAGAGAARLHLVRPDPQGVFGFEAPGSAVALALPPGDVELWIGRSDVRRPGYAALRYELRDDPRYGRLLERSAAAGLPGDYAVGVLTLTAAYAVRLQPPGLLAHQDRPLSVAEIRGFWRINDCGHGFEAALRACLEAGWLVRADLTDPMVLLAYAPVRGRTRAAPNETDVDRQREKHDDVVKTSTGNDDDERRTTTNDARMAAREIPQGGGGQGTAERRETIRRQLQRMAGEQPQKPAWTPKALATELAARLIELRKQRPGTRPYPLEVRDHRDLLAAAAVAIERGAIAELWGLLRATAGWADGGAGFRRALRDAGYLPETRSAR